MIELNILVIGFNRTGKTLLSNSIYNHESVSNCPTSLLEDKPIKIDKVISIKRKYNLQILSTSKLHTETSNYHDNSTNPIKKFDYIICMADLTNEKSFKFIESFLFGNNGIHEEYFSMSKVMIVVTREDLKENLSFSLTEFKKRCSDLNIKSTITNLLDQQSNRNLVDKIFSNISLNHNLTYTNKNAPSRLLLESIYTDFPAQTFYEINK